MTKPFLEHPGSPGGFGALMDEYVRAAEGLCDVVETLSPEVFDATRADDDPDCVSIRSVCEHVLNACAGYCRDLLLALQADPDGAPQRLYQRLEGPADLRPLLAEGIRATELATLPMRDWSGKQVMDLRFVQSWGQIYDPEILLEHAVCHLLRHRRQIERWESTPVQAS
jgi:uncharacterized damage-inducible protein DinB